MSKTRLAKRSKPIIHYTNIRLFNNAGIGIPECRAHDEILDTDSSRYTRTGIVADVTCKACLKHLALNKVQAEQQRKESLLSGVRRYWEIMAKGPGKFEGEARYVPYLWTEALDDGISPDADGVVKVEIHASDKELFPELKRRRFVGLYETNDGFVVEIGKHREY